LVREIARDPALRGKVIPLAFHVDYWDHLGWRDAFSSPEWSRRQMIYVRALALPSAYTPQMVINGTRQFVGTNRRAYEAAVADASKQPPAGTLQMTTKQSGDSLEATIVANVTEAARPLDLWLAIAQNGAVTKIAAGENGGTTIDNAAIVRKLIRVDVLRSGTTKKTVVVPIDKKWGAVTGIAFLQERGTMAIRCATMAP